MNKILLVFLFIGSFVFAQGQSINLTIGGGITQGKSEYVSDYAFGADINYLFDVYEGIQAGPSLGMLFFGGREDKQIKTESSMYLPIGISVLFQAFEEYFFIGSDAGYAVGLSPEGNESGVYFKPYVGYNLSEEFKVSLSYSVVKKDNSSAFIGLNLTYDFTGNGVTGYGGGVSF